MTIYIAYDDRSSMGTVEKGYRLFTNKKEAKKYGKENRLAVLLLGKKPTKGDIERKLRFEDVPDSDNLINRN